MSSVKSDELCAALLARVGTFRPLELDENEISGATWVAAVQQAAPVVGSWMRARRIPSTIVESTLADIDRHLRLHREHTGQVGFDAPWWLAEVLSGSLFQMGRLQFALRLLRRAETPPPGHSGRWLLDVHIPEAGPLTPSAVADSFDAAAPFFAEYFPEQPVDTAVCASWLLDPYLAQQLAPVSNIVRFQQMFIPYGEQRDDDLDALYFIFGTRNLAGLPLLPRESSLQRLVLERLESGERWHVAHGYRELFSPPNPSAR